MGTAAAQSWQDLLLTMGLWALLAAGSALLLWALIGNRSCGRKRCPKCWYDMSGATATAEAVRPTGNRANTAASVTREVFTCPECGKRVVGERGLTRTKRRWGCAVLGAVAALSASNLHFALPRYPREGLGALIPTSLLVFAAPVGRETWERKGEHGSWFTPPADSLVKRVVARESREGSWDWHRAILARRVYAAHPYMARFLVNAPSHWSTDQPLRVGLRSDWFYYAPQSSRVWVRLQGAGARWHDAASAGTAFPVISTEPLKSGEIRLDVRFTWKGLRIWSGEQSAQIELVGPFSACMGGKGGREHDESIQSSAPRLLLYNREWGLYLDEDARNTFTAAARVEVAQDGVVRGSVEFVGQNWGCQDIDWTGPPRYYGGRVYWKEATPTPVELMRGSWTLRFASSPDLAMFDYSTPEKLDRTKQWPECANRYWVGEFEIPAVIDTTWEDARLQSRR